jgi:hypothetical protein
MDYRRGLRAITAASAILPVMGPISRKAQRLV